jgi:hypothetical protein
MYSIAAGTYMSRAIQLRYASYIFTTLLSAKTFALPIAIVGGKPHHFLQILDQPIHGLLECAFLGSLYGGVGLCAVKVHGDRDGQIRLYKDVPDHREKQIHGGHRRSERGGIPAQNWQISHPRFGRLRVGRHHPTRSC